MDICKKIHLRKNLKLKTQMIWRKVMIDNINKDTLKIVHSKSQAVLLLQDKIITPLYRLMQKTLTLEHRFQKHLNGVYSFT